MGDNAAKQAPFVSDSYLLVRFLTINRLLAFFFWRVLYPLVGTPQGEQGCRPPDERPSPPPMG